MVRALMIKYIKEHYDDSARETFKASNRWLAAFSFRCGLSYRRKSNKKPTSAAERVPKLQRWHARLRRRLQRGEFKKEEYKPAALNKRGEKVDIIVSAQSSHRETPGGTAWDLDCGLCAVKNAASDSTLTLPGLLAVVRPLEEERQKSQEARGAHFLEEGEGNFSGQGLITFLEQNDYECITGRGHLWELVEMLCCTDIGARFLGVVYHLPGESASCYKRPIRAHHTYDNCAVFGLTPFTGHWVGASYEHSARPFHERRWFFKDSMGSVVRVAPFSSVRAELEKAHRGEHDYFGIVDLA
jgi:hypothetical protein